jgi:hypothetical protein
VKVEVDQRIQQLGQMSNACHGFNPRPVSLILRDWFGATGMSDVLLHFGKDDSES